MKNIHDKFFYNIKKENDFIHSSLQCIITLMAPSSPDFALSNAKPTSFKL